MNKPLILKKSMTMLLTLVLLAFVAPVMAQETSAAPDRNVPATSSAGQGPTDPAELEAFLDAFFARRMKERHIAGAAIAIVKDGKLFFVKGYGYADLERKISVDPKQTMFYVGSLGKVFTWTAVMQLVEQGKLNLDADVNTYLDFRVPATYPQPITLKHLMAHTSGFEERWLESVVSDANELMPAREWLASNMAARVRPPGDSAGYSNYNAMLAGYIVARASGKPYDKYIQEHIFTPLGMAHSAARSPIPPDLRPNLSMGYTYTDGAFRAFPEYIPQPALWPSGSHQASAADMARFMIAHLQDGRYSDERISEARILKESTARQMKTILYTPDPRLLGMAYGFADMSDNGQRTLGHQGYALAMGSQLLLLPDQSLGLFVVFNTMGIGDLTTQHFGFQRAFFDHYYPASPVAPLEPPADFAKRAGRFVGLYRAASAAASTPDKVAVAFGLNRLEISDRGDGTLLLSIKGAEFRFVEVEPLYFRQVDGPFAIVFREDDRGRITHLFTDLQPQYGSVKMDWYETLGFNMALFLICVLIFVSMILVAVIRFVRSRLGSDRRPASGGARIANWVIMGVCLLNLLFLAGFALWFRPPTELHGVALVIQIVLGLGVMAAVLTVGALVCTVLAWKNGYWGVVARVYYTLVTVAAIAFVWFLNYWNLLGWRF